MNVAQKTPYTDALEYIADLEHQRNYLLAAAKALCELLPNDAWSLATYHAADELVALREAIESVESSKEANT